MLFKDYLVYPRHKALTPEMEKALKQSGSHSSFPNCIVFACCMTVRAFLRSYLVDTIIQCAKTNT